MDKSCLKTENRRILFVAHSSGLYGAERSLLDVVVGLRGRGWQTDVIVPSVGAFTEFLAEQKIPYIVRLHKAWIGSHPRIFRIPYRVVLNAMALQILKCELAGKYDLVYTNTISKPLGLTLAGQWGLPHVLHVREFVDVDLGHTYDFGKKFSLSWAGHRSDRVICNSRAVCAALTPHISKEKLRVVYNGMLTAASPTIAPRVKSLSGKRPLILCMVGHLHESKGHADAIQALARLRSLGADVILEIAGTGEEAYQQEMELLAAKLGVGDQVRFLGFCNDVAAVFKKSDIHLVCSRCEAFGRVAVESMAVGLPVVGPRTGGIPEIVRNGVSGLLYTPGDIENLVNKISRLVEEHGLYQSFSRQGQQDVYKSFSSEKTLDDIEEILCEALAMKSRTV